MRKYKQHYYHHALDVVVDKNMLKVVSQRPEHILNEFRRNECEESAGLCDDRELSRTVRPPSDCGAFHVHVLIIRAPVGKADIIIRYSQD